MMAKIIYNNNNNKILLANDENIQLDKYIENTDIDNIAFNYLRNLEIQQIYNENLEDLYVYDGIPLYYFERPSLYLKLKHMLTCFILVKNILDDIDDEIYVETDDDIMFDICKYIFKIRCNLLAYNSREKQKKHIVGKVFLRQIKGFHNYLKFKINKSKKENILVISNIINVNYIKKHNINQLVDTQIGSVINVLNNSFNIINLQGLFNLDYIDKSLKYKEDYVPFESFILYKKFFSKKILKNSFLKNNLNNIELLDFSYDNYDFKEVIIKYIFNNIENKYLEDLKEILAAEQFIKKHKIVKCIVTDEGDRPRCFIAAAHRMKIKSYALQHGVINDTSPAYTIITKYKKSIIPDNTFLWGEKYKKMLMQNTNLYNNDNLFVVGQVRTDLLVNNNKVTKQYKDNKIKILYATQYFKDLLIQATDMLFQALSLLEKEYELIIKLHPADNYFSIYEEMISKYNIKNVRIVKDEDLYELLNWCDTVVSVHSTVIAEGALLKKPSVCIKLPKYDDAASFIKDGLSVGVKNKYGLRNFFENIDKYEFDEKFNNYIENNFYCVDGNVSQRIVDLIK
ncbi:UDP-N-acetylglucosamine 2-epimerase [Clostridium sp. DL1XJH146]